MKLKALTRATTCTIWFIAFLTLASELSKPLMDYLKSVTGHHWATKGIFSLLFFLALYFIIPEGKVNIKKEVRAVIISTMVAFLMIVLFFLFEFFKA